MSDWSSDVCSSDLFALEDYWVFADSDLDFNDLIANLVQISVFIDQNTDNVITTPSACSLAGTCQPGDPLFVIDSDHDGSIEFVMVPEPASLLMFGLGFLALGRSEEHTSELQSLMRISYAVFCLKKKNRITYTHTTQSIRTTY